MINIHHSLKSLRTILKKQKPSKIVLVSSGRLILKLSWAVKELKKFASDEIQIIRVHDGEKAKEWNVLKNLLNDFAKNNLDRKSLIIALGGGSLTDLVGFAASIYLRGINYINIPTTLLGQVDSGIGGKTAINFRRYKNQVGTFYEPIAIIIDTRFLNTLNKAQMTDGLAEIIKAGLIKDPTILDIIKSHNLAELKKGSVIKKLISKAIKVKEYFVSGDLEDNGARQILNFGHTVAHALELKYELSHGQAVLAGMEEELKIGEKIKKTEIDVRKLLSGILQKLNIGLSDRNKKIEWKSILHDKKVSGKIIILPVIKKIGKSELIKIKLGKLAANIG